MQTETLNKIKKLMANSDAFATCFAKYREVTADPSCDKHIAGFNLDQRFSAFRVTLSFDSCTGYYGSSSCTQFFHCSSDLAGEYVVRAINYHKEEIFATVAAMMREDAEGMVAKAQQEIAALQKMVSEIVSTPSDEAA